MGVRKKKKGWRRKKHPYSSFHVRAEHGYTAGFSASACVCAQGVREGGGEKRALSLLAGRLYAGERVGVVNGGGGGGGGRSVPTTTKSAPPSPPFCHDDYCDGVCARGRVAFDRRTKGG